MAPARWLACPLLYSRGSVCKSASSLATDPDREGGNLATGQYVVLQRSGVQTREGNGVEPLERRKEPRIEIHQDVMITLLGEPDSPPFPVVAVDMSGSGMRILSERPVPYQAAVKVEVGDLLLLGEVIRVQSSDRGNMVALKFWHLLNPGVVQRVAGPSRGA
jgi:hypothetical protein